MSSLQLLYAEKLRQELAQLSPQQFLGNVLSSVLLFKSCLSPEEEDAGTPFCGADGVALKKALLALGFTPENYCGFATDQLDEIDHALCALDPLYLLVTDEQAASLIIELVRADALRTGNVEQVQAIDAAGFFSVGSSLYYRGIYVLNLAGFAEALTSPVRKREMWAALKSLSPKRIRY